MRHALRLLRRTPIVTATALLSLAIGIGANSAVFSFARALLTPAPAGVAAPERLVDIGVDRGDGGLNPASYPAYLAVRERATLLDGVYAHPMFPQAMTLAVSDASPEPVFGQFVSTSYFDVLGATPAAGRLFHAHDGDRPGASPVAVLSHRFWTRRFGATPTIVGRAIRLNGEAFTIVGIAADRFQGAGITSPDVWVPLNMNRSLRASASAGAANSLGGWLNIGARLAPGVSIDAAAAEIAAIGETFLRESAPSEAQSPGSAQSSHATDPQAARSLRLVPSSPVPGNQRIASVLVLLLAALVSIVLLVACANVAGLLLARGSARRREMAVRLAIGAGRPQLARQLLIETIVLFAIGGAAGLAVARLLSALLAASLPALPFPIAIPLALDARAVAFTMALSLAAALIFGLAPALQGSKTDLLTALKADADGDAAGSRARLRQTFVLAQVAGSLVLIVIAGLFARALVRAGSLDPGFDPRCVEVATINFPSAIYADAARTRVARELLDRLRQRTDVRAAAIARMPPGGFETMRLGAIAASSAAHDNRSMQPDWNIVEPGYFAALRLPLLAGRDFDATDDAGAPPAAIVSESIARRLWPDGQAVGQLLHRPQDAGAAEAHRPLLVVGVVRDIASSTMIDGLSQGMVYVPLRQHDSAALASTLVFLVRSAQGGRMADALRALVSAVAPDLTIATTHTLEEELSLGRMPQRAAASIAGALGIVGVTLAAIGVYGVTAYLVSRRRREFGIRMALGATPGDIARLVLREGFTIIAGGCLIGGAIAVLAARAVAGLLFGIPALDPVSFGAAALLLACAGCAACYGPARAAMRADPAAPLRLE